jgi:anti-anti-sigma factor
MCSIEVVHYDPVWRAVMVAASGDVDSAVGDALVAAVESLTAQADEVIADLSAVTFFGAAGVNALVACRLLCEARGVVVSLRLPSRCVTRTLELCGLTTSLGLAELTVNRVGPSSDLSSVDWTSVVPRLTWEGPGPRATRRRRSAAQAIARIESMSFAIGDPDEPAQGSEHSDKTRSLREDHDWPASLPPAPAGEDEGHGMTEHDLIASDPQRDDVDLPRALLGLAQLALGTQPLTASLERVAKLAAAAIPSADGVGLTMLEGGRRQTVVGSAPFVMEVEGVQYGIGEGPCITAVSDERAIRSRSLGDDPQWPSFGPQAAALGVHSALSLPLTVDGVVVGALNLFARRHDAFSDQAVSVAEVFATAAAVAVHNVKTLMESQRVAAQLKAALTNRATIDHAIGILMSRQGGTSEEAFAVLRQMSQADNVKVAVVAEQLIDEAVSRARARRTQLPAGEG